MKAKIAKQEGEVRSAKKMNESLNKQIRMLEQALKNERAKKAAVAGESAPAAEVKKDAKGKTGPGLDIRSLSSSNRRARNLFCTCWCCQEYLLTRVQTASLNKPHNSLLDINPDSAEGHKDFQREKSQLYLKKCVEEITYLLTPPAHPPPPQGGLQAMQNSGGFMNQGDAPMEEIYLQHRQKSQQQMSHMGLNSTMPNHQPPPVPSVSDLPNLTHSSQPPQQATIMTREPSGQQSLPQHSGLPVESLPSQTQQSQGSQNFVTIPDEQVEKITHSYDSFGNQLTNREEEAPAVRATVVDDPDAWNFEEPTNQTENPLDQAPPRRPDTDAFPSANSIPAKSPPRGGPRSHRRKSSGATAMSRRRSEGHETREGGSLGPRSEPPTFKVRFALRGHLDVVRSVIFTGGGSPSEPEICTAGDDGMIKRWIIPASYMSQHGMSNDLDISSYFSHRGHDGAVTSLAACPSSASFSTGGRVSGDGWIFSGGQDATVRVWERGRVDPKATLEGHTDAVWTVCVLPATCASVFGPDSSNYGGPDRILLASGSADGTIKIWAVSAPPQLVSPQTGSRRGVGGSRRHSVTSGSNYPSSPQPSVATSTPFHYMLVHTIERATYASPTCISPLSLTGETFVVSYNDCSILIFDTRTGEEIIGMASSETYDGTPTTGVNTVVATSAGLDGTMALDSGRGLTEDEGVIHGATGSTGGGGVEGVVITGHEDQFIRFFDANSGKCRPLPIFRNIADGSDHQDNVLIACLPIRHRSPPYHSAKTAEKQYPLDTMLLFASGP
jgi:striatin 1/3/4